MQTVASVGAAAVLFLTLLAPDFHALYDTHQWFALRDALRAATDAPPFFHAAVAAAFNDNTAEGSLRTAIESSDDPELQADARTWLIYLRMRGGRYNEALAEVDRGLSVHPDSDSLKNARALFASLARFPDQSVNKWRASRLHYRIRGGNVVAPAKLNGRSVDAILDTGANLSLVSEAEASRLGLKLGDSRSSASDAAGKSVAARTAMAAEVTIGQVQLRNVAFLVIADSQQPFVNLPLGERVVLGVPVLLAMRSVRWSQDGVFEIGLASAKRDMARANLCFDGAQIIAQAQLGDDAIQMLVDTGAVRTRGLPLLALDFPDLAGDVAAEETTVTGVGGSVSVGAIPLPALTVGIRGVDVPLGATELLISDTAPDHRWWHVWLGADLLQHARSVTIDFESMMFDVSSR